MIEVLLQNEPYRYVKMPDLLENGQPDYRIQKWNNHNGYKDMYLCDNFMQFKTCLLYTSPSPRDGLLSRMPSSA